MAENPDIDRGQAFPTSRLPLSQDDSVDPSHPIPQNTSWQTNQQSRIPQSNSPSEQENLGQLARKLNASVLLVRAQVLLQNRQLDEAQSLIREAQDIAKDIGNELLQARCDFWSGVMYIGRGQDQCAAEAFLDSLPMAASDCPETKLYRPYMRKYVNLLSRHIKDTSGNEAEAVETVRKVYTEIFGSEEVKGIMERIFTEIHTFEGIRNSPNLSLELCLARPVPHSDQETETIDATDSSCPDDSAGQSSVKCDWRRDSVLSPTMKDLLAKMEIDPDWKASGTEPSPELHTMANLEINTGWKPSMVEPSPEHDKVDELMETLKHCKSKRRSRNFAPTLETPLSVETNMLSNELQERSTLNSAIFITLATEISNSADRQAIIHQADATTRDLQSTTTTKLIAAQPVETRGSDVMGDYTGDEGGNRAFGKLADKTDQMTGEQSEHSERSSQRLLEPESEPSSGPATKTIAPKRHSLPLSQLPVSPVSPQSEPQTFEQQYSTTDQAAARRRDQFPLSLDKALHIAQAMGSRSSTSSINSFGADQTLHDVPADVNDRRSSTSSSHTRSDHSLASEKVTRQYTRSNPSTAPPTPELLSDRGLYCALAPDKAAERVEAASGRRRSFGDHPAAAQVVSDDDGHFNVRSSSSSNSMRGSTKPDISSPLKESFSPF